jgi:hypothetical protein
MKTKYEPGPSLCDHCGERPAVCIGKYDEASGIEELACNECCGHGNEDGYCYGLSALCSVRSALLAAEARQQAAVAIAVDAALGEVARQQGGIAEPTASEARAHGIAAGCAGVMYGDASCGFKNCVEVK